MEEKKEGTVSSPKESINQSSTVVSSSETEGKGTGGFVLSILGILLSWIPIIGLVISIIALVLTISQNKKSKTKLSSAGFVLSIIAIVLSLILGVVGAVTIIWAAIIPLINSDLEAGTTCLDATAQIRIIDTGKTCVDSKGNLNIEVGRGAGSLDLSALKFIVSSKGDAKSYDVTSGLPGSNEKVLITLSNEDFSSADTVSIAPTVLTHEGPKNCDVSAPTQIRKC